MTEHGSVERPSRWPRRTVAAIGGVALGGAVIVPYATIVRQNDEALGPAGDAAYTLAQERNTCLITDARIVQKEVTGTVLDVTVRLRGRVDPSSRNKEFDKFGVDVNFQDETGNLVSGLRLTRLDQQGKGEETLLVGKNTNPTDPVGTIEAQERFLRIDNEMHRYVVYRQNAVSETVSGPLVTDTGHTRAALIGCGTIQYDKQGHLTVIPPQG